jgi:sulfoquinovosidase
MLARPRLPSALGLSTIVLASVLSGAACGKDESDETPFIELEGAGATVRVRATPFELRVVNGSGKEILRTLPGGSTDPYGSPGATRDVGPDSVTAIPGWDGYVPDEKPWTHARTARLVAQTPTTASFQLDTAGGNIDVDVAIEGVKVTIKTKARAAAPPEEAWNKIDLSFALPADEHFFGLGERYASVDHRGLSMYSWAEEGGTGQGENVSPRLTNNPRPNGPSMTYFPVPFFLSSAGYAMHLATTYRTETHFGSERPDAWRVATNKEDLEIVVYVHDDPLASLDDFTRDTGRPFVPATWVFGPRRRVSLGSVVGTVPEYQWLRQQKVPTTGVDDAVHFLPARSELGREAALGQWVKDAHAWGYKVMAYNNPYVSTSKDSAAADRAYGEQNGLFAKTPEGKTGETFFISGEPQTLATIDLTNPAGVAWFQDLLRRTLALGYDGWMHDFGEYVRRPWRFFDGRNGEALHNEFPVLSAKAAHDLMTAERPGDFLFFVRSGYTGTQRWVPAVWGGDPEATFDESQGLPAMLRGGINLGLTGVPLWGSDVTGFKCLTDDPADKEMYIRWGQVGAVSPIMMEQNACANPIANRTKWKLWGDEETIAAYAASARLHTRLAPYFDVLARAAHATGVPIMRHPFLYYPREPETWTEESSFFLGPALYASPVVRRGQRAKDLWLPPGKWVELEGFAVHEGGRRVTVDAPLVKLPLLVRDGGIVPMLDVSVETLAPATEPSVVTADSVKDRLDVVVALSRGRDATITLADGTELVARRGEAPGARSNLAEVAPAETQTCQGGCFAATREGGVDRLRISTPLGTSFEVTHEDVTVTARGPSARRVRFDVLRL